MSKTNDWLTRHWTNMGNQYYQNQDFNNAIRYYQKALNRNFNPQIVYNLVIAERASGHDDAALQTIDFGINNDSKYWGFYYLKGQIYMDHKKYSMALPYFNSKAYHLTNQNTTPYYMTLMADGVCCSHLKNFEGARNCFEKAVQANESSIKAHLLCGNACMDSADYSKGSQQFTAAININPKIAVLYYNRAHCLILKKQYYKELHRVIAPNIRARMDRTVKHDLQTAVSLNSQFKGPVQNLEKLTGNSAHKIQLKGDPTKKLNQMIGLNTVKKDLRRYIVSIKQGNHRNESMNLVFEGNPGTGKTQVSKLIPKILYQHHVLKKPVFVTHSASYFVRGARHFAAGVRMDHAVKNALGGVLFIDEAYGLTPDHNDGDPRPEIINVLLQDAENYRGQLIIILAGYPKPMENFLDNSNPGLRRRFNRIINFPDYTPEELYQIFVSMSFHAGYLINAKDYLYIRKHLQDFVEYMQAKNKDDGNGGLVRNLLDFISDAQMDRQIDTHDGNNSHILMHSDIIKGFRALYRTNHIDPSKITGGSSASFNPNENAYAELQQMIGLGNVKKRVNEFIDNVKANQLLNNSNSIDLGSMNMIFEGSPGTGKTQVARLVAKILYQEHILSMPKLIEHSAKDLIGQYTGETAPKTTKIVKSAFGGVLFLDEAYSLGGSGGKTVGGDDFNAEAIATLIQLMENHRHNLLVIMAGYTRPMEKFLNNTNPGLNSRFQNKILFKDYTPDEMYQILMLHARNPKYKCRFADDAKSEAKSRMYNLVRFVMDNNLPRGNGRDARNVLQAIVQARNVRIVHNLNKYRNDLKTIIPNDVDKGFQNVLDSKRLER